MPLKFWVLVGEGANDVMIPALIFGANLTDALARCCDLFKHEPKVHEEESGTEYRWCDEEEGVTHEVIEKIYTSYYGGCGECYAFTLKQVEEGKPFVCWNLD